MAGIGYSRASAQEFSWDTSTITGSVVTDKPSPYERPDVDCDVESFYVGNSLFPDSGCVYHQAGFDYAYATHVTVTWWGERLSETFFTIRFDGETRMHKVHDIPFDRYQFRSVPQSQDIIFNVPNQYTYGGTVNILRSLPDKLIRTIGSDLSVEYRVLPNSYEPLLKSETTTRITTKAFGISPNGRWAVVEAMGRGLVRVDLANSVYRWFSHYLASYGYGDDGNMQFAVTNDGRRVAVAGLNITPHVSEINETCGYEGDTFKQAWQTADYHTGFCSDQTLIPAFYAATGKTPRFTSYPTFSYDGGQLDMFVEPHWRENEAYLPSWVRVSPQGYEANNLAYLAIGDSYSSGEGDIGKKADGSSYYLPQTNSGKDNCHISERSYPYLISDHFGIDPTHMRSVACSGARVAFDYYRPLTNYTGQNERLSQLSSSDDISHAQNEALDSYMPGYVPQLEFVKKYKPRAITLTGGGNDVGFGNLIEYCASFHWESVVADDTCGFALPNSDLRKMLGRTIYDQYAYTIRLINAIKQASPRTIINIVGYPSFIAGKSATCILNAGVLDEEEREMINEGVAYMNDVLEKAANETGVQFIDIENSLVGGRLCEGSEFVTGIVDIGFSMEDSALMQTFHPNAIGHQKIASSILSSGKLSLIGNASPLMTSSIEPPAIPAYFGGETTQGVVTRQENILLTDQIPQNEFITLNLPAQTFQPGSTITVAMYSNPIELGTYTASPDGATEVQIHLPKEAHIGRHIITVMGNSYSGERLQLFQFAEVTSGDPTDKDGDGIKNTEDKCDYISHYYDEVTGKDICVQSDPDPEPGLFPTTGQLATLERTRSTDVESDANETGALSFGIESSEVAKLFTTPGISVSDRSNDLKWQGKEVTLRELMLIIICIIVGMVIAIGVVYVKRRR